MELFALAPLNHLKHNRAMTPTPATERIEPKSVPAAAPARLMSLDALRGFDMFWIIGGGAIFQGLAQALDGPLDFVRPQFEHVRWAGLHFWDLIWPLFMFVVGVSIPLSIEKRQAAGATKRSLYLHAARRAIILFVLGMVLQGRLLAWDLDKLRPCYSVLHGIAAGYLIAFAVALELRPRAQGAVLAGFLLAYWAVLELIPVPGVGAGVLTPDGNVAAWVDRLVLGRFHYGENTWFLSYAGFASSVLLGVLAGRLLMSSAAPNIKVLALAGAGAACIALGLLWSLVFPIIKLLWTSSFVLVGGGYGFLMLALFYWVIDVRGWRQWAFFFTVIGMNSIAGYTATMLFSFKQVGNIVVGSLLPRIRPWDSFVEASGALLTVWLLLYWMFRTRTFLKL
jgi:predicted acyltransferase